MFELCRMFAWTLMLLVPLDWKHHSLDVRTPHSVYRFSGLCRRARCEKMAVSLVLADLRPSWRIWAVLVFWRLEVEEGWDDIWYRLRFWVFLRSVTITEREYAGPDYTSGKTLSTTVGIEHEKDARLLAPLCCLSFVLLACRKCQQHQAVIWNRCWPFIDFISIKPLFLIQLKDLLFFLAVGFADGFALRI